jgi:hypothetical protein
MQELFSSGHTEYVLKKEVDENSKTPHNLTSSQLTDTTLRQAAVAALAASRSLTINSR